jgi:predicted nucleic acid-binding protein
LQNCLLDTSYLITLSDPSRAGHEVAKSYFKACINSGTVMYLSTIAIAEFSVKQVIPDLIYANCIVLPFNVDEAIETARIHTLLDDANKASAKTSKPSEASERTALKDDLKLIAQAHKNEINFVLTEDKATFQKTVVRLSAMGHSALKVVLLIDGFDSTLFTGGQHSLTLETQ